MEHKPSTPIPRPTRLVNQAQFHNAQAVRDIRSGDAEHAMFALGELAACLELILADGEQ